MKYAVTGSTGLLGTALARSGADVVPISRSAAGAFRPGDPAAFEGVDAVVHLAGEPVPGRWTKAKRERIRSSRVDGTRALVETLASLPDGGRPATLIAASAVGWYGDRGDEELDEESAGGAAGEFLADVCRAWEDEAASASDLGMRVVHVRYGLVLSADGGALKQMLLPAKLGVSGPLGGGRQWWSWLHIDDAVALIKWAAEGDVRGVVAGTTASPMRQREFARTLGRVLRRPAFLPAPAWALKLVMGGFAAEVLTSKKLIPRRTAEAGFSPRHPELEGALRDLLGRSPGR